MSQFPGERIVYMIPCDGYYWACYDKTGANSEIVYAARDADIVFRIGTPTKYKTADFTFIGEPIREVKTPNISMEISKGKQ